jgi:hypothetical protein
MSQLLAPQTLETLDTWGSIDSLDAFGTLEALDSIELFETTASVSIAFTQSTVAGEILFAAGAASVAVTATAVANRLFDADNALNTTFNVDVVNSGGNKYRLTMTAPVSGSALVAPTLTLVRGVTYTFNVSDSSNNNHPLRFKDSSGNSYSSGVTVSGTEGQANATVVFTVPGDAPTSLRYYCTVHGESMGNTISVTGDAFGNVANISLTATSTSERLRTVSATPAIAISAVGGGVFNQIGATASITLSIANSATIEAIEHVSAQVIFIVSATATPQRIQHSSASETIAITGTGLPNFTAVFGGSETVSLTPVGEFFVTSAFNASQEISLASTISGEILGERWIPITKSLNNVWHLR